MAREPIQIDRDKLLAIAHRTATPAQRKTLAALEGAQALKPR